MVCSLTCKTYSTPIFWSVGKRARRPLEQKTRVSDPAITAIIAVMGKQAKRRRAVTYRLSDEELLYVNAAAHVNATTIQEFIHNCVMGVVTPMQQSGELDAIVERLRGQRG